MPATEVSQLIERIPGLGTLGLKVARQMHNAVLEGGERIRTVVDLLHGTWMGHPLHPVLTDVTIGAWTFATVFDGIARYTGARHAEQSADTLTALGIAASLPTAITGLADFSVIKKDAASSGTLHALVNDVAITLYLLSLKERRQGNRRRGERLALLGLVALMGGAWLGGHLVYRKNVGANHSNMPSAAEWTPVLEATDLENHRPTCVQLDGEPVLLVRDDGHVHALAATCSHAGGPLHEGTVVDGVKIQCPWHDSTFDLRTGRVVHGPATHPQPALQARIANGRVELLRARST